MSKVTEVVLFKHAMQEMVATILGAGIPGLQPMRQDQGWEYPPIVLYATWELTWGVEVTLMVSGRSPDDKGTYEVSVRINSPTCEKSVSAAIAYADLYTKVAHLAALLDTQWGSKRLYLKAPTEPAQPTTVEVSQLHHGNLRCAVIPESFPVDADIYVGKIRGRGLKAHVLLAFKSKGLIASETSCVMYAVRDVAIGSRVMVEHAVGTWVKATVGA